MSDSTVDLQETPSDWNARQGREFLLEKVRQKKVSIVIVNDNGRDVLPYALQSIKRSAHPVEEVILADDCSTDGSPEMARRLLPGLKVLRLPKQTRKPSRVRNAGITRASADLVFVMDNDVILDPSCLTRLLEAHELFPRAAICTPRLMCANDRERIYTDGQRLHFLCHPIALNRNQLAAGRPQAVENTSGGRILLLDKKRASRVGFFDEEYGFGWGEDSEMFHKLTILGEKCYHVPRAVGFHLPEKRTAQRAFYQVRNRWLLILETYSWRTILLLAPVLLAHEALLFGVLCAKGAGLDYLRANKNIVRHLPRILLKRNIFQNQRKVSDRDRLQSGDIYAPPALPTNGFLRFGLRLSNGLFSAYWIVIRRFL
jgi:GT2 family glycosyltransferase